MVDAVRPLLADLLTIVIPTRDRPDLLERCLQSVYEHQETIPTVIVSDNSKATSDGVQLLRNWYPFSYVRQSGTLSMTEHHNACLRLPRTPWAILLHDDDELADNALTGLRAVVAGADGAGLVVCGHQWIDDEGKTIGEWLPEANGVFRGEDIVLLLGLDFQVSQPSCIWNLAAFSQVGGFPDANGMSADYPLVLHLANSPGVMLSREVVGRYRIGQQQTTDYSTPERAEATLDVSIKMAEHTRSIGVSAGTADQLIDYMTWWIFRIVAGHLLHSHTSVVFRLCQKCESVSPPDGAWRRRVRTEYPLLFLRPSWMGVLLYKATRLLPGPVRGWLGRHARATTAAATTGPGMLRQALNAILPAQARRQLRKARALGARLRLGFRVAPLSDVWGFDRGLPLHRYYLEQFLTECRSDIRGHCLEFQYDSYTSRYGGAAVTRLDILHVDGSNPHATIIADLTRPNDIPSNTFDCIICTHVLHVIFDLRVAIEELHRILKPGGVLLVTVPHISMSDPGWHEMWRFTPEGLATLVGKTFGRECVTIRAYGNSLTAAGELRGLVSDEFSRTTLDYVDFRFAVEVCARARKLDDS